MLEGKKIRLALFTDALIEEHVLLSNDLGSRGDHMPIRPYTLIDWQKRFREKGWWDEHEGALAILDREDRLVGSIGFFHSLPHLAGYELGYSILRPEDRGKGYMSEALSLFVGYLFALKPIPRLQVIVHTENAASRRVAEKVGFQYEGTLRHAAFHRGQYTDCDLLSLLRADAPAFEG